MVRGSEARSRALIQGGGGSGVSVRVGVGVSVGVAVIKRVGAGNKEEVGEGKVVIGAAAVPARVAVRVGVSPGLPGVVGVEAGN